MTSPGSAIVVRPQRLPAAERRAQLAQVAAARFHRLGYHRVSLADVAEDAGVTAPAVYRHFRNKQALLAAAISSGLDLVEGALARTSGGSLDELVSATAEVGVERSDLWILLQRESRFLDADSAAQVYGQFGLIIDGFVRRLRRERPALDPDTARFLVTAATAVLSSPSAGRTSLPRRAYQRELTQAALAALRAELPVPAAEATAGLPGAATAPRDSRRDAVVDAAIELFFQRGYGAVTLDDIGTSVGMAGPSLYHHFATKADILVTALDRATSQMEANFGDRPESARPALDQMVRSYAEFCLQNRALIGIYVSEVFNLPPAAWERTKTVIRQGIGAWTGALLDTDSQLEEPVARVRVRAALAAIHDLARLGHMHQRPGVATEIALVACTILRLDRVPGLLIG